MFDNTLRDALFSAKSIAIVGAKDKIGQPVDRVGRYLIERGFTVYPIHPVRKNVWGLETYKDIFELAKRLKEKNESLDIVCLFRAPEYCYEHAVETIESGLKPSLFWLQEGIKSQETAEYIHKQGIHYKEDLCIMIEYERLLPKEFSCMRCGICCTGENGIVVDNSKDLPRLLDYFSDINSIEELDAKYCIQHNGKRVLRSAEHGSCMFFEEGKGCTIHPARPDICRAWAYFRGNMIDDISFEMAKTDCKGIIPKARHKAFQKEGIEYLQEHHLLKSPQDTSAANALKYTEEEITLFTQQD